VRIKNALKNGITIHGTLIAQLVSVKYLRLTDTGDSEGVNDE